MQEQASYFREALREPLNLGGLLMVAVGAVGAGVTGIVAPALVIAAGAIVEGLYLVVVPNAAAYRRRIDRRSRTLDDGQRQGRRQEIIQSFDPREREAVAYLSLMKNQIAGNYRKISGLSGSSTQISELEAAWEAFVDLLDEFRRRKNHLRTVDRQAIENQLRQAERSAQVADSQARELHEKNVELLKRRLDTVVEIERSVKRIEAQLQMIENFFSLINDQLVTMPTPDRQLSGEFDSLLASIDATREILQQTAPVVSQLDHLARQAIERRQTLVNL
ncbi:MAG: hypothetical protein ACOYLF_06925 [Blastocatellia bacterium]|jgi:vacuolar-type H+-ATPase subunit E/Vma4